MLMNGIMKHYAKIVMETQSRVSLPFLKIAYSFTKVMMGIALRQLLKSFTHSYATACLNPSSPLKSGRSIIIAT